MSCSDEGAPPKAQIPVSAPDFEPQPPSCSEVRRANRENSFRRRIAYSECAATSLKREAIIEALSHSPLKEKTSFSTSERASSAIVQRR